MQSYIRNQGISNFIFVKKYSNWSKNNLDQFKNKNSTTTMVKAYIYKKILVLLLSPNIIGDNIKGIKCTNYFIF